MSKSIYVKEIAQNPNTPVDELEAMFEIGKEDTALLRWLCRNPNLPVEILEEMSSHKDVPILIAVAGNPNTPIEILQKFLDPENDAHVRIGALYNLKARRPDVVKVTEY